MNDAKRKLFDFRSCAAKIKPPFNSCYSREKQGLKTITLSLHGLIDSHDKSLSYRHATPQAQPHVKAPNEKFRASPDIKAKKVDSCNEHL